MTDHVARLYALALALVVFCLSWAVVAARPWAADASAKDPRIVKLERREQRLRRESIRVQRLVQRRFAAYRVALRERQVEIAAANAANAANAAAASAVVSSGSAGVSTSSGSSGGAGGASSGPGPSVGVVSLPPVTSTSTS